MSARAETGAWNPVVTALEAPETSWVTLPITEEQPPPSVRAALDEFDGGGSPAGRAATEWLQNEALAAHRTSRTRLLIMEGRLAGYYSLASAQVALRQRDRKRLGLTRTVVSVPATLVTWMAKDRHAPIDGSDLLLHAAGTARQAAAFQASALLVVDPFDEGTARIWRERYGFRSSAEPGSAKRLWLPLHPD